MLPERTMRRFESEAVRVTVESPVGRLTLVASDEGLHALLFSRDERHCRKALRHMDEAPGHAVLAGATDQLSEYFAGRRKVFDVPLALEGTPFQERVWEQLTRIPYGATRNYGEIAAKLGGAGKARAVGAANGRNPVAIIVPCHRVIGKDGSLTGFGGGLDSKTFLLELEARS